MGYEASFSDVTPWKYALSIFLAFALLLANCDKLIPNSYPSHYDCGFALVIWICCLYGSPSKISWTEMRGMINYSDNYFLLNIFYLLMWSAEKNNKIHFDGLVAVLWFYVKQKYSMVQISYLRVDFVFWRCYVWGLPSLKSYPIIWDFFPIDHLVVSNSFVLILFHEQFPCFFLRVIFIFNATQLIASEFIFPYVG